MRSISRSTRELGSSAETCKFDSEWKYAVRNSKAILSGGVQFWIHQPMAIKPVRTFGYFYDRTLAAEAKQSSSCAPPTDFTLHVAVEAKFMKLLFTHQ